MKNAIRSSGISSRPTTFKILKISASFKKYNNFLSNVEIQSNAISLKKPFKPPNNKTTWAIIFIGLLCGWFNNVLNDVLFLKD